MVGIAEVVAELHMGATTAERLLVVLRRGEEVVDTLTGIVAGPFSQAAQVRPRPGAASSAVREDTRPSTTTKIPPT